jgi:hypothetical protein
VTISVAYFACVYQRNHRGLWHLLGYGAGVTLLTAPYWLTVMLQHGFDPFLNAFTHGEYNLAVTIAKLLAFNFTEENLISILAVLALLGWFSLFAQRKFGLFGWFLLLIVLDPRSANRTAVLPLMMAAGVAVNAVLLPGFNSLRQNISGPQGDEPQVSGSLSADLNSSTGKSVLISLFLITFISTYMSGFLSQPGLTALSVDNRQAMAWIGQNTPKEAQFFVLPASQSWFTDKVSEWFPSLANRKSITTVQGLEWLPKSVQAEKIKLYAEIFRCQPPYMTCIQTIDQPTIGTFDYIYVSLQGNENQTSVFDTSVAFELQLDARYKLVYKNSSVEIFEKSYLD